MHPCVFTHHVTHIRIDGRCERSPRFCWEGRHIEERGNDEHDDVDELLCVDNTTLSAKKDMMSVREREGGEEGKNVWERKETLEPH